MPKPAKSKRINLILKSVIDDILDPFYLNVTPGIAYYFILSIAPIILSLSYFASFLFIDSDIMTNAISDYLPAQLSGILLPFFSHQSATAGLITTVIFFVFTLYLASRGCYALIKIADYADGNLTAPTLKAAPKRFMLRHVKAIVLTLLMIAIIVISLIIMVFGRAILDIALSYMDLTNLSKLISSLSNLMSYPLTAAVLFFILMVFYAWMPTERLHLSSVIPGALFSTFGIIIASFIFMLYIKYFFGNNAIYGALSSIIILLLWFFILSYVLVFGIIINRAFRLHPNNEKDKNSLAQKYPRL